MSLIALLFLSLASFFSPLRAIPQFNYVWATVLVFWVIVTVLDDPLKINIDRSYIIPTLIFVIYTITIAYMYGNSRIGNRYLEISQVFVFYIAYEKNRRAHRKNINNALIMFYAPLALIISLLTLLAYQVNPIISRGLRTGDLIDNEALIRGIGGYEFVYMLVVVFPVLLFLYREKIFRVRVRMLLLLLVSIMGVNIVMSNYALAIMITIISTTLTILSRYIYPKLVMVYSIVLAFILPALLKPVGKALIFFSQYFYKTSSDRFYQLGLVLDRGFVGNALNARINSYLNSVDVFFDNIFVGVVFENLNLEYSYGVTGFGQHSQILDTFALFGIFIGLLQLYILAYPFITRMKYANRKLKNYAFTVMLTMIIVITFNNITPSIGLAGFFVFPVVYDIVADYSKTEASQYV